VTIGVEMTIDAHLKTIIRKNSPASVGTDGLMGNKLINIDPGTNETELVSEGDTLVSTPAVNTEQMLRTLQLTNENMSLISVNLKNITNNITRNKGTLYKILLDTSMADRFYKTVNNIEAVSGNLNNFSGDLSTLSTDMKQGKGMLGTLFKDTVMTAELQQAIRNIKASGEQINSSTSDLKNILQKLNSGEGTASVILNDTVTANQFKRSVLNLENSTKNFNENMEGLKHSFLLRGYFKKQAKKKNENK
jgi:phospholipid/cholesterol/gamma-HCH transport system substrate-binding protein